MQQIQTTAAPTPLGPYSQATVANGFVYVAMQLAVDADGTHHKDATLPEQIEIVLHNIKAILEAAGSTLDNTLKVTIFSPDLSQGAEVNRIYEEIFTSPVKPARTVIGVSALPLGYKIAAEAVGAVTN